MKLHTNSHTGSSITAALRTVKDRGQVSTPVGFEVFSEHGSRSHDRAYEIQLGWYGVKVKGDGRHWKNSGKNGAADVYAATYDEWGWLILELFTLDPEMTFGSYKSLEDFHRQTKDAFKV